MNTSARYSKSANIFPNRPFWNEHGAWVEAPKTPPICWCPKNPPPATNLCEKCRAIRIRHVIFCEAEGRVVDLGKLNDLVHRPECDFCSLISLACQQTWWGRWDEPAREGTTCYINALDPMRQQAKGYALQFTARVPSNWQWLELEAVFKGHDSYLEPSSSRFEICPTTDVEFLKTSVKICESNHERCVAVAGSITPEKMLIIDLEDMCVKPAPGGCRYVALSYVWGKITENWLALTRDNFVSMGRKNALIGASLPHTIKDAMQLCLDLGEQYLWIDSLCILQDDPVSQKQQIDIMDLIYASATLTIVAAAGDHANSGLPGIRRWSRTAKRQTITIQDIEISNILPRMADTAEKSVWNTRGWTYQERMFSRRCIFLTDGQAFYACSEEVCYERKNRLLPTNWSVERLDTKYKFKTLIEFYSHAVQEYTLRSLTSPADIFRAFQGIMNDMTQKWDQKFFFGLPSKNFEDALLWQEAGQAEKRIANVALPSWSWACVNGAVKFSFTERRVVETSQIPAFWPDDQEPKQFGIDWLLNENGSQLSRINDTPPFPASSTFSAIKPPADLVSTTLQKPGRLLFETQYAIFNLANNVPFVTEDSWFTDYTQDVNFSKRSIASILRAGNPGDPIGFIELDKAWAEQNLIQEGEPHPWQFIAISLAAMDPKDFMNRHFTARRNVDYPLVLSRNVRELIVNVMLVEKLETVARRLGVGKVYLDCWELAVPQRTWVVLE